MLMLQARQYRSLVLAGHEHCRCGTRSTTSLCGVDHLLWPRPLGGQAMHPSGRQEGRQEVGQKRKNIWIQSICREISATLGFL